MENVNNNDDTAENDRPQQGDWKSTTIVNKIKFNELFLWIKLNEDEMFIEIIKCIQFDRPSKNWDSFPLHSAVAEQ
jgi:hypothetical protein